MSVTMNFCFPETHKHRFAYACAREGAVWWLARDAIARYWGL